MADSLFSIAIWFDLCLFLAHKGLLFVMKMHKQLCHGEGWVLAWCSGLKGIISSWHGSGFSFKWFLEADRTSYECGLAIFVFLDEGLTETRLFVMQSRCYKTQRGWKECARSWHSDLNRAAFPQELIYPYLWSLWIRRHSFPRVFWESRCLRFGLTTPHYHVGQRGFRVHESMWSGPSPQAAVAAFCLPRTSELLSLIALHARKHRFVVGKGGWCLSMHGGSWKHSEIIKVQILDHIEGPWSCHPLIWKLHLFHMGLFFGSCVSGLKSPIVAFLFCSFEPSRPFFLNKSQILFPSLALISTVEAHLLGHFL